jgi:hypothetical protein
MVRKPESKSFLESGVRKKRDPAKRLGFFVKRDRAGIFEILPKHLSYLSMVIS